MGWTNTILDKLTLIGDYIADANDGKKIQTSNAIQEQFLLEILREVKKINLYLSEITDMEINNTEL